MGVWSDLPDSKEDVTNYIKQELRKELTKFFGNA